MGSFFRGIQQGLHKIDPVDRWASGLVGLDFKPKPVPPVPTPPNIDTATQSVLDQQDMNSRRKGVLANIFAGGSQQSTASGSIGKTTLGG